MPHYDLVETRTTDKPARFYANGKRVSRDFFEHIKQMACMYGQFNCLNTRAWPLDGGRIKRKNYSIASWTKGE